MNSADCLLRTLESKIQFLDYRRTLRTDCFLSKSFSVRSINCLSEALRFSKRASISSDSGYISDTGSIRAVLHSL